MSKETAYGVAFNFDSININEIIGHNHNHILVNQQNSSNIHQ